MKNQQIKSIIFLVIILILGALFLVYAGNSHPPISAKVTPLAKDIKKDGSIDVYNGNDEFKEPSKEPELIIAKTEKMSPGFTLVPRYRIPEITLINNQGKVINSWEINARRVRLLPNCNLLVVHKKHDFIENGVKRDTSQLASEYNWEGRLINEYPVAGDIHHDVQLLSNNQILLLYRNYIADKNPLLNYKNLLSKFPKYTLKYDALQITDRVTKQAVFHWNFLDSFKADSCSNFPCPWKSKRFIRSDANHVDWTHVNSISEIPENQWYTTGHPEFKPGNIMLTVRNWSAILILDKDSKQVVWQYGGEAQGGFEGGHDAHMIPPNYPGAGNILIFDNGDPRLRLNIHTGVSHVVEFNPVTKAEVWNYDADKTLLSISMGTAQRLRNGNTLVSEDTTGRILEVTPKKEIVWQYEANRHTARAYRYELGYCKKFNSQETQKQ